MVHTLLLAERRFNDYVEGLGLCEGFGPSYHGRLVNKAVGFDAGSETPTVHKGRILLFPLLRGLLNQPMTLPLRFLQGLHFELAVVNTFTPAHATNRYKA